MFHFRTLAKTAVMSLSTLLLTINFSSCRSGKKSENAALQPKTPVADPIISPEWQNQGDENSFKKRAGKAKNELSSTSTLKLQGSKSTPNEKTGDKSADFASLVYSLGIPMEEPELGEVPDHSSKGSQQELNLLKSLKEGDDCSDLVQDTDSYYERLSGGMALILEKLEKTDLGQTGLFKKTETLKGREAFAYNYNLNPTQIENFVSNFTKGLESGTENFPLNLSGRLSGGSNETSLALFITSQGKINATEKEQENGQGSLASEAFVDLSKKDFKLSVAAMGSMNSEDAKNDLSKGKTKLNLHVRGGTDAFIKLEVTALMEIVEAGQTEEESMALRFMLQKQGEKSARISIFAGKKDEEFKQELDVALDDKNRCIVKKRLDI